ncbi:hypothetical protein [Anaeromassilibacillus senegalensis]|uniref:hypothetical protein n=1 Tax=Anaeromassilibacillus senegalensis TaxID=1673717 RepID=UPI00067FFDDA|nr:hypothetical protein [Anaeromassilibacillus senegalensis]
MERTENLYLVTSYSDRKLHVWATSGGQAKRLYCREYGIRPSDAWCGVSSLTAHKLTPAEVAAWQGQTEMSRVTGAFITGMLDLHAKVYEDACRR